MQSRFPIAPDGESTVVEFAISEGPLESAPTPADPPANRPERSVALRQLIAHLPSNQQYPLLIKPFQMSKGLNNATPSPPPRHGCESRSDGVRRRFRRRTQRKFAARRVAESRSRVAEGEAPKLTPFQPSRR